jgi:hypothetical protein
MAIVNKPFKSKPKKWRGIQKSKMTNNVGNNAANDSPTTGGTPSGILISNFFTLVK